MGKKIYRVVLTGGPASGKTTLISRILKEFKQDDGWRVITIPETATELILPTRSTRKSLPSKRQKSCRRKRCSSFTTARFWTTRHTSPTRSLPKRFIASAARPRPRCSQATTRCCISSPVPRARSLRTTSATPRAASR